MNQQKGRFIYRVIGSALSLSLVVTAPGVPAYAAVGKTVTVPRVSAPGTGVSGAALSLQAQSLSLAPSALNAAPVLSVIPGASLSAPSAAETPSAALPAAAAAAAVAAPQTALTRLASPETAAAVAEINRPDASAERSHSVGRTMLDGGKKVSDDGEGVLAAVGARAPAARLAPAAPAAARKAETGRLHFLNRAMAEPRHRLAKFLSIVGLSLGLLSASYPAMAEVAQDKLRGPAPIVLAQATTPAPAPTAAADEQRLPAPVAVQSIAIDRQGATVGERLKVTLTLRNTTDKAVTITALRASVQESFPADVEIQDRGAEQPLTLAPGESKTVVYEIIAFSSGELTFKGGVAYVPVAEAAQYPKGIELVMPDATLKITTVLTPDWKKKGLRDIVSVISAKGPHWAWLAAIPLALLLAVGAIGLVNARKHYPKLTAERLSLVAATEGKIGALQASAPSMDTAAFYAEVQELLSDFLADFAGLPKRARDAETLRKDLKKSKAYDDGVVAAAYDLAGRAQKARFSGESSTPEDRRLDAGRLLSIVEKAARKSETPVEPKSSAMGFGLLAAADGALGLHFGNPWVLALLVPLAAYGVWTYLRRSEGAKFDVSSPDQLPAKRSWRERLIGLPTGMRWLALILIVTALARPQIGVNRQETFIPSTDTVISVDISGSMDAKVDAERTRLQAAGDAVRAYVEEQRRGTQNRVGLVTFDDNAYVAVRVTTDYDALIQAFKELKTKGSTAIGKSILTSIGHLAEVNIRELSGDVDPTIKEVQRILRVNGLAAALEYAKPHPGLLDRILQPDRTKIVVVFTDGDSNSGIAPADAARIAAQLKIKVYTVGIGSDGPGFAALREVAALTGAKYFSAGDGEAMRAVLLEISRLERSPTKVFASVAVKDYTSELSILAFLLLIGGIGLANTRLRQLHGMALALALPVAGLNLPVADVAPKAPVAQTILAQAPVTTLTGDVVARVPADLAEANRLYNQGNFAEAVRKYGELAGRYPDIPEIYFNMGDAYMRLGELNRAEESFRKYLGLTKDPRRLSQTFYNLGNLAVARKDGARAIEFYKEALRRDATNADAKWNLEALRQQQKEQEEKDGKDGKKNQKGQKGKKPGEKGQKGEKGDQQGEPGDQQGEPGDQQGDGKPQDGKAPPKEGQPKPDQQKGADELGQQLGEQEGQERDAQRRGITRRGDGVWGVAPIGLLAFADQGVTFASGGLLWAAAAGVALAVGWVGWGMIKRLRDARRLSPGTAPKTFKGWWGRRNFIVRTGALLTAVVLVGLTMADPRGGARDERVNFGGKDVEVVVDVSHSTIYAEDGRHERTRRELNTFISRLQGTDRVGLVVFSGQPRTASPISVDYSNFEFKIDRLDVEARGLKEGSNLAAAVRYAAERFDLAKKIGDRQRIMIVISDGDVPAEEIAKAIEAAQQHKVTIYAIGVGTPNGSRIMVPTVDGKGVEPLIDSKTNQPAITRLVEAPLQQLAERTGGAYFRSGDDSSIERILKEVASREQGDRGDVIKSPSPIGSYLLWPALLLLLAEMLLKPASLLKRPGRSAAKKDEKDPPSSGAGPAGLAAVALLPLGAWPQILPFALLGAAVAALIAVEIWTGGKLTRSVRENWQRRTGYVEDGVARDLALLYDLREADENVLTSFVGQWRAAKDDQRPVLIRYAAQDQALWREKLTAAFLAGASPETSELLLGAMTKAARAHVEPLAPVVERVSANRGKLAWTVHGDAAARFERLEALARGQTRLVEPAAPAAKAPLSWTARAGRAVSLVVVAAMLAISGAATVGSLKYSQEQAVARAEAARIFFADDSYVFNDRYVDARIPELVLPALREWYSSSRGDQAAMERALAVLRESPDPKADNILLLLFKRGDIIPLSDKAQTTLLTALMERESDELWALVEKALAESGDKPGSVVLLKKMVLIGAELGTEKAFVNLFHVLKSPNAEVRKLTADTLYGSLADPARAAKFFERLTAVQQKFSADPILQLWTAQFAMRHLAVLPAGSPLNDQARVLFDKIMAASTAFDRARVPAIAQALAAGQEPQAPAFLPALLGLVENMEKSTVGADGQVPPAVAGMSRYVVNQALTKLIKDGEARLPGLTQRLTAAGVIKTDSSETIQRGYRESYKLSHIRQFSEILVEMGQAAVPDPKKAKPELLEYLTRAGESLEPLANAGALAGMMEGGSPAELAAESLYPALKEGAKALGQPFLLALRAAGLAPAVGDPDSVLAYPEALDPAGVAKVRELLMSRVRAGQGWNADGTDRALTWNEKVYLAKALIVVDGVIRGTPATPASDDAFFDSIKAAGEESIAAARLKAGIDANLNNPDFLLRAERVLLERLTSGAGVTPEDVSEVLPHLFKSLADAGREADAWRLLADAVAANPGSAALKQAVVVQSAATVKSLGEQGKSLFGEAFTERLLNGDVMYDATTFRSDLNQRHIAALRDVLAEQRAQTRTPGESAARRLVPHFHGAYMKFPGSVFLDELRDRGWALKNGSTDINAAYLRRYSRADVAGLLAWTKSYQQGGVTKTNTGATTTRPFDAEERQILAKLVAELEDLLKSYPPSGSLSVEQREALFSPAEKAFFARAGALAVMLEAAEKAGLSRGDDPAENAGDRLAGWLHRGYMKFPGSTFLEDARAAGFALNNGEAARDKAYPKTYTRAEVARMLKWLQDFEKGGRTRTDSSGGTRVFDEVEKKLVADMIAAAKKSLAEFPPEAAAPTQLRGFGLALPFLAAAPVVPVSWLLGLGLLALAAFAGWAFWALRGPAEDEAQPREGVSNEVLARHKRIELAAARLAKSAQWGAFRSRAKGDGGLEYAESREFEPGDTLRDVDWNEYAQTGELRTKVFDQEREMPLILVIDVSPSGRFGTLGAQKHAVIEDVAATLALAAARTNLRVGAVLFSDRVEAVIPPGGGKAHGWRVAQAALQVRAEGKGTDLRQALDAASKLAKTRAIVTVLSDFIAPGDFKEALAAVGARHDLRLIRVVDPSETRALPDVGLLPVADAESGAARVLDTSSAGVRQEVAGAVARREALIEESFAAVRTRPIVLTTEGDALDDLASHFRPKTKTGAVQP